MAQKRNEVADAINQAKREDAECNSVMQTQVMWNGYVDEKEAKNAC